MKKQGLNIPYFSRTELPSFCEDSQLGRHVLCSFLFIFATYMYCSHHVDCPVFPHRRAAQLLPRCCPTPSRYVSQCPRLGLSPVAVALIDIAIDIAITIALGFTVASLGPLSLAATVTISLPSPTSLAVPSPCPPQLSATTCNSSTCSASHSVSGPSRHPGNVPDALQLPCVASHGTQASGA
ncbi:hypothetical protein PLICRDRAFT_353392 [Plicaturopsis crispa FD-325 SS-3]|uniref:Uncharacterized protein n=1 Tax=Plicaturopsis crispa FD-325 SS-3 TaxID=944288 RepID=A0A0C9SXS6_PLICR|nr:hypothetical protein PLICRDRAFT_353392 [Plicaturopsis crispa FD-325 SS-3]